MTTSPSQAAAATTATTGTAAAAAAAAPSLPVSDGAAAVAAMSNINQSLEDAAGSGNLDNAGAAGGDMELKCDGAAAADDTAAGT